MTGRPEKEISSREKFAIFYPGHFAPLANIKSTNHPYGPAPKISS